MQEDPLSTVRENEGEDQSASIASVREGTVKVDTPLSSTKEQILVGRLIYNGEIKHYAIVPGPMITSQPDLFRLMKFWNLSTPDFILETNTASIGSRDIITKENAPCMLQDIFFRKHDPARPKPRKALKSPVPFGGEATTEDEDEDDNDHSAGEPEWSVDPDFLGPHKWIDSLLGKPEQLDPNDLKWINRYVQRKLSCSLSSMVSAADMLNGWIFCHGTPSLNEQLLEGAIESTGSAPTTLVVDNAKKYDDFFYTALKSQALTMRGIDAEGGDQTEVFDLDSLIANHPSPSDVLKTRSAVSFTASEPGDHPLWNVEDDILVRQTPVYNISFCTLCSTHTSFFLSDGQTPLDAWNSFHLFGSV